MAGAPCNNKLQDLVDGGCSCGACSGVFDKAPELILNFRRRLSMRPVVRMHGVVQGPTHKGTRTSSHRSACQRARAFSPATSHLKAANCMQKLGWIRISEYLRFRLMCGFNNPGSENRNTGHEKAKHQTVPHEAARQARGALRRHDTLRATRYRCAVKRNCSC